MAGQRRSVAEVATGAVVLLAAAGFLAYAVANTGRSGMGGTRLSARFQNAGALAAGSDVRVAGVKVGSVTALSIDPASYEAVVSLTVRSDVKMPTDSSATISSGGLLGGASLSLVPGGADAMLQDGGVLTITQSAVNLEDLLGKFIFNVGSLADATQKSLQRQGQAPGQEAGQGAEQQPAAKP